MRFKLDENVPSEIAVFLRAEGHDVETVLDESLSGKPDRAIAEAARIEQRVLASLDKDFADLRSFPPSEHEGLLVFRPARQDPATLVRLWRSLLPVLARESVRGQLWIVEERGVRRRST